MHEKFETPGIEMLSGMQERTILIRESACGAARPGVAKSRSTRASDLHASDLHASSGMPRMDRAIRRPSS